MAFKVQVGPAQIAIHQGQTVLVTEPDGQINWPSKRGLYFRDTRVISAWAIYANGEAWDLLNGGAVAPHAARIFQTNRAFVSEDGPIAARTLGLMIGRHIDGGLHEDIDITNNSQNPVRFNLGDRDPRRFRRHLRGEGRQHRAARPHHHVMVGKAADAPHHLSQQGFLPRSDRPHRRGRRRADGECQRAAELRRRAEGRAGLASLPDLRPGGRCETHPGAAGMHPFQRDIGPCSARWTNGSARF